MIADISVRAACKQGRLFISDSHVSLRGRKAWEMGRAEVAGVRCVPGLLSADLTILMHDGHGIPLDGVTFREALSIVEQLGYIAPPRDLPNASAPAGRRVEIACVYTGNKLVVTATKVRLTGVAGWSLPRAAIASVSCVGGSIAADLCILADDGRRLCVESLPFNGALHALNLLSPPAEATFTTNPSPIGHDAATTPALELDTEHPLKPDPAPQTDPEPMSRPAPVASPSDLVPGPTILDHPIQESTPASPQIREPAPQSESIREPEVRFAARAAMMHAEAHAHLRPDTPERPLHRPARRNRYTRFSVNSVNSPNSNAHEQRIPDVLVAEPSRLSQPPEPLAADEDLTLLSGTLLNGKRTLASSEQHPAVPMTKSAPDASAVRSKVDAFRASIRTAPPARQAPAPDPDPDDAGDDLAAPAIHKEPAPQPAPDPDGDLPSAPPRRDPRHQSPRLPRLPRPAIGVVTARAHRLAARAVAVIARAFTWLARSRALVRFARNGVRALASAAKRVCLGLITFARARRHSIDKRTLHGAFVLLLLALGGAALLVAGDSGRSASPAASRPAQKAHAATASGAPAPSNTLAPTATPAASGAASGTASQVGNVFVGSRDGSVYALAASDGHLVWRFSAGAAIESAPAYAGGIIYFGSDDSYVYAIRAADHQMLWRYQTGAKNVASPAVVNGVVYIGSYDTSLYALRASDGALLWRYWTSGSLASAPAVVNGVVYVGSFDNSVYALRASDGTFIWRYQASSRILSAPSVVKGIVYIDTADGAVYALRTGDGTVLWQYATRGPIATPPAVHDGILYVGAHDQTVYALDAGSGHLLWSYRTGAAVS